MNLLSFYFFASCPNYLSYFSGNYDSVIRFGMMPRNFPQKMEGCKNYKNNNQKAGLVFCKHIGNL